jgi:hypothetical protein
VRARVFHAARTQREPAHRVQCLGGEDVVGEAAGHLVAAVAELARARRLIAMVQDDRQPAQRFRQDRLIAGALRDRNRGFVELDGFRYAGSSLLDASFVQQIDSRTHFEEWTNRCTAPSRSVLLNPLFRVGGTHQATT